MKTAIIPISSAARKIAQSIEGEIIMRDSVAERWNDYEAFVFVGAMGICVRTIAPLLADKHSDPAVVCVDACGRFVVAVASGHIGGANELTNDIAHTLGATPVITTLSDSLGTWQLDTIARRFGWTQNFLDCNKEIALFTSGKHTALLLTVRDLGTEWMESNLPDNVTVFYRYEDIPMERFSLLLAVSPQLSHCQPIPCLHYIPRVLIVGIGLAHKAEPALDIVEEMKTEMRTLGIEPEAIKEFATIDEKRGEPVVELLQERQRKVTFFSGEELKQVDVPNPSMTVEKYMGTRSVGEAAALLASGGGYLIVEKRKGAKWTLAAALCAENARKGRVEFVGAGPGDPDLVSVRGRQLLQRADLILYAGSLVPRTLTACAKDGARVVSSAGMTLEEQVQLMADYWKRGLMVVRLHTGDPCLFGAIQEQMNLLDQRGIAYRITPGISAFQAAAAELRSQFTIPRKTQTIILTRGEGRTPMPPSEKLSLLARSHSTMCIYLSADIVEKVQEELLTEYPADTPVAVCYRLTWPEQRIYRGVLSDMASIVRGNNLSLDTLLVIGEAIDNRQGLSELYSKHFSHLYRKAGKTSCDFDQELCGNKKTWHKGD